MFRRSIVLLAFLGFSLTATADVYKWRDASGEVHYSDQPPTDQAAQVHVNAPPTEQTDSAIRELTEKNQAFDKRREEAAQAKEKADKEAAEARTKQENCERARTNLSNLNSYRRIYTTDANGQSQYMDDQQRADALASSQKAISDSCH